MTATRPSFFRASSIASVSRFALTSRTPDAAHGARLEVDGGRTGELQPHPHPVGLDLGRERHCPKSLA